MACSAVGGVPAVGEGVVEAAGMDLLQPVRVAAAILAQKGQAIEAGLAAGLAHHIEGGLHLLLAPERLTQVIQMVDEEERLVVELQVARMLEVVLDPERQEIRHQVGLVGDAGLSARLVFPHDRELQLADEARLEEGIVDGRAEVHLYRPALARAVPAVDEEGDAMLDGPLGLPVGDLGVLLRVEAEDGGALGMLHHVGPHLRLVGLPQRAVVRPDEEARLHRHRLGNVGAGLDLGIRLRHGWHGRISFLAAMTAHTGSEQRQRREHRGAGGSRTMWGQILISD